jgi:hypothetical protein
MKHNITITIDTEALHYLEQLAKEHNKTIEDLASLMVIRRVMAEKPGELERFARQVAERYKQDNND